MKKLNTERTNAPITAANVMQVARAAAYVTVRRAYLSTPRAIRDGGGQVLGYDGSTTGGADMVRRLWQGFRQGLHSAEGVAEKAAAALDAATDDTAAALADLTAAMDGYTAATANDADDLVQTAALSLWEAIADTPDGTAPEGAFLDACRAVDRAIHAEQSNTGVRVRVKTDSAGNVLRSDEYRYTRLPHLYVDHLAVDDSGELIADIVDVSDALSRYQRGEGLRDDIRAIMSRLTDRERQTLVWYASGATHETIARRLHIAPATARKRYSRLVKRCRDIAQAHGIPFPL